MRSVLLFGRLWVVCFAVVWAASSVANAAVIDGLLVVDSGTDRVLLLDPVNGSILNDRLIEDPNLLTPVNAIDSGRGTIFVSDQLLDEVREYSTTGQFLRTVVNNTQVDNIRGIAVRNNSLYVTVAGGNAGAGRLHTVQQFDLNTGIQSTFIDTNGGTASAVLGSPWDVTFRENDVLVSDSVVERVRRFDFNGNFVGDLSGLTIDFPQQVVDTPDGDVLVANSANGGGLLRFDDSGAFTGAFAGQGIFSARGVAELENGQFLYGGGINLITIDPSTNSSATLISESGRSFRYIERVSITAVPEPSSLAFLTITGGVIAARRRRRSASLS